MGNGWVDFAAGRIGSGEMSSDMEQPYRLDGKVSLVTGGASGIGAAIARELARAGAEVLVADLDLEAAQGLAGELSLGRAVQMDVSEAASIGAALDQIPTLDILVNNAGISMAADLASTSEEEFERLMRVNVHGVYLVTRALLPQLLMSHGCIVNIGSVAGIVGVKKRFAYSASKGAVVAMTRQIAVDYPKEIRCNCVAPGTVQTPYLEGYLEKYHKHEKDKARAEMIARQPSGRLGTPEDIASLVRFLCSREASYITGAVLPVDGGWTAA